MRRAPPKDSTRNPSCRKIERPQASEASERDWQTAPLDEIVKHIVGTHHEYLKVELPALGNRMYKVLAVHGTKDQQTLNRLTDVFSSLRAQMEMHMHKEELMLFPFLEQYCWRRNPGPTSTAAGSLRVCRQPYRGDGT